MPWMQLTMSFTYIHENQTAFFRLLVQNSEQMFIKIWHFTIQFQAMIN